MTGDVTTQGYEVRSPWGDWTLGRRRLATTLGLSAYHLQGDFRPLAADYAVRLMFRFDADYGVDSEEVELYAANPGRFVPGLERSPLDLLYGYVEGRNLWDGWLGFRVGRQTMTDSLGWWSFDGGLIRLTTPWFFQLEGYGGLEQRGGLPFSSSRYERQGVWRGSFSEIGDEVGLYPSYQRATLAPAFGVAIESDGPSWLHGRLSYRRVYNLGEAVTGQLATPDGSYPTVSGPRISQDRLGYALSASLPEVGALRGGFVYDLYAELVSGVNASVDVFAGPRVTVGADLDYLVPTFDADSIWGWFTTQPSTSLLARATVRPLERLELAASGGTRLWATAGDPSTYARDECAYLYRDDAVAQERCRLGAGSLSSAASTRFAQREQERATSLAPDVLGNVSAGYRWPTGSATARGSVQWSAGDGGADRGHIVGGSLGARQAVGDRRYWLGGAVDLYEWSDALRAARSTTSFGYLLAPEYVPFDSARLRLEWSHDINPLVGHRFRVLAAVQMQVVP